MKQTLSVLSAALTAALLSSCLKETAPDPIIIDPLTWTHSTAWVETEIKTGTAGWETVTNSNELTLWWDYADSSQTNINGAYHYYPENLGINIDTMGYMQTKDSSLLYINFASDGQKDSAQVQYLIDDDSSLVICNTSADPAIAIRFRKKGVR
ncbi:hypothetical protein [Compostibacter hankyongensis]|uniref:Uncharacterized protein n=1 Tax=Compostibacter hankyongensis TaxID=1007089 RepID=A0ABP8FXT7_9BACT